MLQFLVLALLVCRAVVADVSFVTPAKADSYSASSAITITWESSGEDPAYSDLTTATLNLCTGPDDAIDSLYTIFNSQTLSSLDGTYSFTVDAALAASGYFYFQMTSIISSGGYVINYSDRFQITEMTGTLEPTYGDSLDGPDREVHDTSTTTTAITSGNIFTTPYISQADWLTKYAPMQRQPGTTITTTNTKPLYSTSAISSIFLTNTMRASQVTTLTSGWDYTMTSVINDASPRPNPSENGGSYETEAKRKKLMNRWDDILDEEPENVY
ncbi:uncharacterized protein V1516DRAFT_677688 [Lipomyces oligophaga]|uniref:uncharacterized protein n=1 Tax=Lipomyces oligophaga TaxID=45792 RepID=UPI0034CDCF82